MALDRKRKRGAEVIVQKNPTVFEEEPNRMDAEDDASAGSGHLSSGAEESDGEMQVEQEEEDISGKPVTTSTPHTTRRPPTALELRDIKDATDLYRSSSFKLQIDALLPNARPKYKHSPPLDRFLAALHGCLNSIPTVEPRHPLEASKALLKKGIAVPYISPLPTPETNWKVGFEKPSEILLVGSWPNKLSVKAQDKQPFTVDLAVEMPSTLLQEKDYLNSRFFQKRAYFLSVIAAAITNKKKGINADAYFTSPSGDPRQICLTVRPNSGSDDDLTKLNAEVRIIPTMGSTSPIPIQRLSPSRANIRTTSAGETAATELPTPLYNNTLHLSTTPKAQLLRSHTLKNLVPSYADGLTLLRIWANQRGYGRGSKLCIKGFESNGAFWTGVMDLLISGEDTSVASSSKSAKRKPLGKGLSSYQLFRAALDFLARHDFARERIFVKSETVHKFAPEEYPSNSPVFVDSTGVNLLASIPIGSLDTLQYDAKLTLDILNEDLTAQDPFREAFLKDHRDLQTRFDVVMRVDLSSAKLRVSSTHSTLDYGSLYDTLLGTLLSSLRKALGNRAKAVACLHHPCEENLLLETDPTHSPTIYIGLILEVEHAFRLVDHGPTADDPDPQAATRFRDFWGDKAELRRFKDGSITESVVWDVQTSDDRTKIPYYICTHILGLHCGIPGSDIQHWQDPFDATLRLPEDVTSVYRAAKAEAGFKAAMTAFDGLVKSVKALDDELPLAVVNISPITDVLRYTSVFTPTAITASSFTSLPRCAHYLQPMDVIVEFEKSGRWPDDLRGIQKVKLAMFERLATKLMESSPGLRATVVVGDPIATSDIMDTASLEIVTPQGWAFSARIWHDRELKLLDTSIDDRPHIPPHIKKKLPGGPDPKVVRASLEAKEVYVRRFLHAPRHHRAVAALCHRYTAYAGTVRLVKRWLASHWVLQKYVSVEASEILCAAVFLGSAKMGTSQPYVASAPGTKERGFAKVVQLLKDWQWQNGIFVPLYGEREGDTAELPKNDLPASGKEGVWRLSTELDPDGYMWTRDAPDAVIARRIQTIASATWSCLQNMERGSLDVTTMFAHPAKQYDFIIELNPALLPRYYQNIHVNPSVWARKGKYANVVDQDKDNHSTVQPGYDPAWRLFNDLSRVYKDTFMLFYDPLGGARFGGVWDPRLKEPRPFKILGKFSAIPAAKEAAKDKTMVVLNKEAILCEIERFGAGLVTGITQCI
ncbi:Nrap protein [Cristinia sonorae]|uniref:U3 small nucleolar RNA-associated protein 22 n=1 Tax=Cristinia sonorae TaxID=1940300 RepID=A0A8K0ULC2_9AGAR|nr:Nrap protein [Cristinia sonorae]